MRWAALADGTSLDMVSAAYKLRAGPIRRSVHTVEYVRNSRDGNEGSKATCVDMTSTVDRHV